MKVGVLRTKRHVESTVVYGCSKMIEESADKVGQQSSLIKVSITLKQDFLGDIVPDDDFF